MKIERSIRNDHIARIEGKAGIFVKIGEEISAKINVTEGPRFFEVITKGRRYDDAVAICPRICSFCSIPHKLTPIEAVENALKIEVSERVKKLREILYLGNMVESHILHLLLFAIPDYLGYPDAFSMTKDHPELMKIGLEIKNFGVFIQELIGSREIHPENAVVGGFGRIPEIKHFYKIGEMAKNILQNATAIVEFFTEYEYPSYVNLARNHLAINPYNGYGVYGEEIKTTDDLTFHVSLYKEHIKENVESYSFAKRGEYKGKPFMVGALSRLVHNNKFINGTAKDLLSEYKKFLTPENPFANNFSQAIEIVHFIEKIKEFAEEIKIRKEEIVKPTEKSGAGCAVTEAPRGLLIYEVEIKDGLIEYMNIITPTAMFLPMMEIDIKNMAKGLWEEGYKDTDLIGKKVEMVMRAYDPCISCSVHVIKL